MKRSTALLMSAAVALVAVVALGGTALGAVSSIPDGSGTIHGCYDSGGNLRVIDTQVTPACPKGYTGLNWNQKGNPGQSVTSTALNPGDPNCPHGGASFTSASPTTYACNGATGAQGQQGPAGISDGVQAFSGTYVTFPTANSYQQVLQTPDVPTTGDYYVSASILTWIDAGAGGDGVYCTVGGTAYVPAAYSVGSSGYQTIALDTDVYVTAGSPITVNCAAYTADPNTYIYQDDANAILIGNDNGVTANGMRPAHSTRHAPRAPALPRRPAALPAK